MTHIGNNVKIEVEDLRIGHESVIEDNVIIKAEKLFVGDNSVIGHDSKILIPELRIGDYTKINNHTLINGYKPCFIGHNCYFGQNDVLNATETLTFGNNVGGGIYSSFWTHGTYGTLSEGCTIAKIAPTIIEDDVWVMGAYTSIFPNVTLGKGSIILPGSVVTTSVPAYRCYAGNPAVDVTDKIHPYRKLTLQERFSMIKDFLRGFEGKIRFVHTLEDKDILNDEESVFFTCENHVSKEYEKVSIFNVATRSYTKKLTSLEIGVIHHLLWEKAKFIPEP
jgi:acetyltransferase-like isoleucine patch superfamily enzyme